MDTDDLIATLAADAAPVRKGAVWRRWALAVLLALAISAVVMTLGWGVRPDLHHAMRTSPFWMKGGYTLALGVAGLLIVERAGRPGVRLGWGVALAGAAVVTILALAAHELMGMPMAGWRADMMGQSAQVCPWRILAISAPVFVIAMLTLRWMAPTRPAVAGAAAGLLAGGLGATVYGLHCQETAAAFTAVWYTLGMALWPLVGALIGRRLLRW
ncbi:NrsF family protein [Caulobacter sp. KR2-114]|uniref:NrsF family protein n=1 Tax=Caulobacter sp. KR2-114 TaxID=3400912 RepID=UPI003C0D91FB